MKVLILNPILFTADNNIIPQVKSIKDTMIYGMCMGFVKLGHTVTLAAAKEYMPTEKEDYDFEVKFFKSDFTHVCKPSVLPYSNELSRWLKRHHQEFELVIASEVFQFATLFAAHICPRKTVVWQELTAHQNKMHQIPSKIWHNVVVRLWMNRVATTVPRSRKAQCFISRYMPRVSGTIIDHGIDLDKFTASTEKERRIISSSQLIHRKNVDGIIHIFSRFHQLKGYEDIQLTIAGRGKEEENLKKLVRELGLQEAVEFVGFLPQDVLGRYISRSLAFLVNTRKDLNMVSIPESIVSGTPILTNRQPASADYIARNRLGIAKEYWNEIDLKDIIDHHAEYVENCLNYRKKLSNFHQAQMLIDQYKITKTAQP